MLRWVTATTFSWFPLQNWGAWPLNSDVDSITGLDFSFLLEATKSICGHPGIFADESRNLRLSVSVENIVCCLSLHNSDFFVCLNALVSHEWLFHGYNIYCAISGLWIKDLNVSNWNFTCLRTALFLFPSFKFDWSLTRHTQLHMEWIIRCHIFASRHIILQLMLQHSLRSLCILILHSTIRRRAQTSPSWSQKLLPIDRLGSEFWSWSWI